MILLIKIISGICHNVENLKLRKKFQAIFLKDILVYISIKLYSSCAICKFLYFSGYSYVILDIF